MKSKNALTMRILMLLCMTAFLSIHQALPAQESSKIQASGNTADIQVPQVTLPAAGAQETIRVLEGKSIVVNSPETIKRVSVTNDQIAVPVVVSPNQVVIHGLKPGSVTFLLWNEQEQMQAFDLQVMQVPMNLEPLRATLASLLPGEVINLSQSGNSVVLTGAVSSQGVADQAATVAKTEVQNVVSLLSVIPQPTQVVLLQVKFAEVGRNAAQQLGMNLISTGALNTPGAISTQQFSPPGTSSISGSPSRRLADFTSTFNLTDILNIFAFRPDLNLAIFIKALQQQSLLEVLAEPNLLAVGGKEASFLAGGEYPVPIVQGTTGTPTVSIQFKEFGVRLKFTADPKPDGTIRLKVNPEVSTLDFANAVTLSGFLIPAMVTRRAETEVELRDGQSFAIAGLLDNRVTKVSNKIPWLGDVPFLGKLFQSQDFKRGNTELLVTVTPQIVKPLEPGQASPLPSYPVPFLNPKTFDGKHGEAQAPKGTVPRGQNR